MEKKYHIDFEPADMRDVISRAQEYGYENKNGIYQTSVAAKILRDNGHKVGNIEEVTS